MKPVSQPPYYDDYNPDKNYVGILAVPGNVEQAREFTQLSTMHNDFLGRLGDALYRNGTIIEGCNIVINSREKTAIISSGRIYLNGLIRIVNGAVIPINAVGSEVVGAKINQTIVTEIEDPSLRDPAQGYENYGQAGAHRIKEEVIFTVNDDTSASLYVLNEGELVKTEVVKNEVDAIVETLARRTYDENGSYKVEGLLMRDKKEVVNDPDPTKQKILVTVTEGKAYVEGYEVYKQTASTIRFNKALTTRRVQGEPHYYSRKDGNIITNYTIVNQPVKELVRISVQSIVKRMRQRSNLGSDAIGNSGILSIESVTLEDSSGNITKTYVAGTDYNYNPAKESIDWVIGQGPQIGETYYVTYIYNEVPPEGEVQLVLNEKTGLNEVHVPNGHWEDSKNVAHRMVEGRPITIDYDYYLSRKDLVTVDKKGEFTIYEGIPDKLDLALVPETYNVKELVIGYATVYANSDHIVVTNSNAIRLSQTDLYNLKKRLYNLEYNIAMTDLEKEASDGEQATLLRGIYTDSFEGTSKCDETHPDFNCSIDLDSNELTLPMTSKITNLNLNTNPNLTNMRNIGRVFMAPYENVVALSQPYATKAVLVNPYAVYNPMCILTLNPPVDNWIEYGTPISITKYQNLPVKTLYRWWYHPNDWIGSWEQNKDDWARLTGKANWAAEDAGRWFEQNITFDTNKGTSTEVLEEAVMYMRVRRIDFVAKNFLPNQNNIELYFDEKRINVYPTNNTYAGTIANTVKADVTGQVQGYFNIPEKVACGVVDVELRCEAGKAAAVYESKGRKQTTKTTVLIERQVIHATDPLAQSFEFEEDTMLTGVGLYFSAGKESGRSIVVQLRNMVNGYPGTTCYAEEELPASAINISSNGTVETRVNFTQPVYCKAFEQYCVCILTDSNTYQMYVAKLGETDLATKQIVSSQAYAAGTLFDSSNAKTWTARQFEDLKFKLYKAQYTGNKGVIVFDDVVFSSDPKDTFNRLLLIAETLSYKNNNIEWSYKVENDAVANGNEWYPITTYADRELSKSCKKFSLKLEFSPTKSTSPLLAGDNISLISFLTESSGAYVSRTVYLDEPYKHVKVMFDAVKPDETGFEVFIELDGNGTWIKMNDPTNDDIVQIDQEFWRYEYNYALPSGSSKTYKVKIAMSTDNPVYRPRIKKLRSIMRESI